MSEETKTRAMGASLIVGGLAFFLYWLALSPHAAHVVACQHSADVEACTVSLDRKG